MSAGHAAAAEPLVYADSSAIVKLVIAEPESAAMWDAVDGVAVATSALARVEVTRAVVLARPETDARLRAAEVLAGCLLVPVSGEVLAAAGGLVGSDLRSLDAIHLASAMMVEPDAVLVYDRRLADAAAQRGLAVRAPA